MAKSSVFGLCACCLLWIWLGFAAGKGYRNGYSSHARDNSELSFNYTPEPLSSDQELPSHWDWCNVDGLDLCASSWNQHECGTLSILSAAVTYWRMLAFVCSNAD